VLHIVGEMFSWPGGIVVGNLLASAMWAGPALLHLDRRMKKRHEQLKAHIHQVASGQQAGPDGPA
jgi:hypothetical protein